MDFNKIVVSNKVSFSKKGFKYFIGYKDRFIDLYVYFSQKLVYTFLLKDVELLKKIKFGKTLKTTSKKNLTVNQIIMKM